MNSWKIERSSLQPPNWTTWNQLRLCHGSIHCAMYRAESENISNCILLGESSTDILRFWVICRFMINDEKTEEIEFASVQLRKCAVESQGARGLKCSTLEHGGMAAVKVSLHSPKPSISTQQVWIPMGSGTHPFNIYWLVSALPAKINTRQDSASKIWTRAAYSNNLLIALSVDSNS